MIKRALLLLLTGLFFASPVVAEESELGLPIGIQAPDFEAITHQGEKIRFSEFYERGPVVLIFYRGGWCMYCNMQLQALQSRLEDFEAYKATIVAVSVDLQENAAKSVKKKDLGFTVVSNPDADLLKLYNVVYRVPDELAKKYKEEYKIDLQAASGRSDHIIAVPATYVIDQSGKIVFAYVNRDYKVRKSSDEILKVLEKLIQ